MMPLGILGSARIAPAVASLVYQGSVPDPGPAGTSHTLTIPVGAASASRTVIIAVTGQYMGAAADWRLNGAPLIVDARSSVSSQTTTTFVRAAVPSGTTAVLTLTTTRSNVTVGVGVWTTGSAIALSSWAEGLNGDGINLTVGAGHAVIAAKYGTAPVAWTGVDEQYDASTLDAQWFSGGHIVTTASGVVSPRVTGGYAGLFALAAAYTLT